MSHFGLIAWSQLDRIISVSRAEEATLPYAKFVVSIIHPHTGDPELKPHAWGPGTWNVVVQCLRCQERGGEVSCGSSFQTSDQVIVPDSVVQYTGHIPNCDGNIFITGVSSIKPFGWFDRWGHAIDPVPLAALLFATAGPSSGLKLQNISTYPLYIVGLYGIDNISVQTSPAVHVFTANSLQISVPGDFFYKVVKIVFTDPNGQLAGVPPLSVTQGEPSAPGLQYQGVKSSFSGRGWILLVSTQPFSFKASGGATVSGSVTPISQSPQGTPQPPVKIDAVLRDVRQVSGLHAVVRVSLTPQNNFCGDVKVWLNDQDKTVRVCQPTYVDFEIPLSSPVATVTVEVAGTKLRQAVYLYPPTSLVGTQNGDLPIYFSADSSGITVYAWVGDGNKISGLGTNTAIASRLLSLFNEYSPTSICYGNCYSVSDIKSKCSSNTDECKRIIEDLLGQFTGGLYVGYFALSPDGSGYKVIIGQPKAKIEYQGSGKSSFAVGVANLPGASIEVLSKEFSGYIIAGGGRYIAGTFIGYRQLQNDIEELRTVEPVLGVTIRDYFAGVVDYTIPKPPVTPTPTQLVQPRPSPMPTQPSPSPTQPVQPSPSPTPVLQIPISIPFKFDVSPVSGDYKFMDLEKGFDITLAASRPYTLKVRLGIKIDDVELPPTYVKINNQYEVKLPADLAKAIVTAKGICKIGLNVPIELYFSFEAVGDDGTAQTVERRWKFDPVCQY